MMFNHCSICNGLLRQVNTVQHCIIIQSGTKAYLHWLNYSESTALATIQKNVDAILQQWDIEPAQRKRSLLVGLVSKPDGSLQFCIDYLWRIAIMIPDTYPAPSMDDCVDSLRAANCFSTLQANSKYWQVQIVEKDADKITFTCQSGIYGIRRTLSGSTNELAAFQRALNILLKKMDWRTCLKYLNNVIVFFKSLIAHLRDKDMVLATLHKAGVLSTWKNVAVLQIM